MFLFFLGVGDHRDLPVLTPSFPTRRSSDLLWYEALNDTPGRVGPPIEPPTGNVRQYFLDWLARDGFPFWPFWENIRSWWAIRDLPNVLLLHFADLKTDMPAEIRRIAAFLDIAIEIGRAHV